MWKATVATASNKVVSRGVQHGACSSVSEALACCALSTRLTPAAWKLSLVISEGIPKIRRWTRNTGLQLQRKPIAACLNKPWCPVSLSLRRDKARPIDIPAWIDAPPSIEQLAISICLGRNSHFYSQVSCPSLHSH